MSKIKPAELIENAIIYIQTNIDKNVSTKEVCRHLDISQAHFIRLFKSEANTTPHACILNIRINKAKELISNGIEISDVAFQMGFFDQSHLNKVFKKYETITPNEYKKSVMCD